MGIFVKCGDCKYFAGRSMIGWGFCTIPLPNYLEGLHVKRLNAMHGSKERLCETFEAKDEKEAPHGNTSGD